MKYKIIFLDIDGVLNGYNFWTSFGWRFVSFIKTERIKSLYRKYFDPDGVHERKVKRLSKIVEATDAKIVMSGSQRFGWRNIPYNKAPKDFKKLTDLFIKYNIDVIDITPDLHRKNFKRDKEILQWLYDNQERVDKYIILDDENTLLPYYNNDNRFIQTSSVDKGVMIKGYYKENTGLKNRHVKEAIRILNSQNIRVVLLYFY